jgi:putative component of membrane protein insertase Oxa1/YidC/SpoIIIJ protein YidD
MGWRQESSRLLALAGIRFYRRFLSRYTPHCAQRPICSTYALHVVREHGGRIGLQMALDRIQHCGKE